MWKKSIFFQCSLDNDKLFSIEAILAWIHYTLHRFVIKTEFTLPGHRDIKFALPGHHDIKFALPGRHGNAFKLTSWHYNSLTPFETPRISYYITLARITINKQTNKQQYYRHQNYQNHYADVRVCVTYANLRWVLYTGGNVSDAYW